MGELRRDCCWPGVALTTGQVELQGLQVRRPHITLLEDQDNIQLTSKWPPDFSSRLDGSSRGRFVGCRDGLADGSAATEYLHDVAMPRVGGPWHGCMQWYALGSPLQRQVRATQRMHDRGNRFCGIKEREAGAICQTLAMLIHAPGLRACSRRAGHADP